MSPYVGVFQRRSGTVNKVSFSVIGNVLAILGWKTVFGKEIEEDKSVLLPAITHGAQGQEVLDGGNRWIFPIKKGWFAKEICKRSMSAKDYIRIFEASHTLPKSNGFLSAKGKKFSAKLKYNPEKMHNGKSSPGIEILFQ